MVRAGGYCGAAEREDGAGQQDGLDGGGAELGEGCGLDGFEVIGSGCAQFGGEGGAGAGTELLGVNAEA